MAPGGIKPRPPKRIHAELPTNVRVSRSNKRLLLDADASPQSEGVSDPKHQTPIAIHKPTVSVPEAEETIPNFDNRTHGVEGKLYYHSNVLSYGSLALFINFDCKTSILSLDVFF